MGATKCIALALEKKCDDLVEAKALNMIEAS
jgi:predicted nucleic acid-binding protein